MTTSSRDTTENTQDSTRAALVQKLQDSEKIHRSITINKSPAEIYTFFRNFGNLPLFMKDLISLNVKSETLSHWVIQLEHGPRVEWDAEITTERYAELISWQTLGDAEILQVGTIWFTKAPRNLGTIVRLHMAHTMPAGKLGKLTTKLIGEDPESLILINLHRLKAYLETGEIPTIQGQPSGRDEDLAPEMKH